MTVSKNGSNLGDLVFELYSNHCPKTSDNFIQFATGNNKLGKSYAGTKIDGGFPGITVQGGKLGCENLAADGIRMPDENLELRHYKRGILTMNNDGENSNGSEFLITLGKSEMLNGYHVAFGELVEGDSVLSEIEESLTRQGGVKADIKIEASGTRWEWSILNYLNLELKFIRESFNIYF